MDNFNDLTALRADAESMVAWLESGSDRDQFQKESHPANNLARFVLTLTDPKDLKSRTSLLNRLLLALPNDADRRDANDSICGSCGSVGNDGWCCYDSVWDDD